MKIRTIVIVALLAIICIMLINTMPLLGIGMDETTTVGWYSEFGGRCVITLYPFYEWLSFPFTICFYLFVTLFLYKVKVQVNKWLGGTFFILWCVNVVAVLLNTILNLYLVFCFNGDEMCRSLEEYWKIGGAHQHPVLWFLRLSDTAISVWHFCYLLSFLVLVPIFVLLIKKDKAMGIIGIITMSISFLMSLFSLPYTYFVHNLCWIVLFVVVLWKLHQSSPHKSFVLQ